MARKRLNRKVALIGSAVFAFFVLVAIFLFLRLTRDPEKFIYEGDAALKMAREATDKEEKEENYKSVIRAYNQARGLAKTDSLKVQMLDKLSEVYIETDSWRNAIGCWNAIVRLDPENIKARYGLLKYFYITAGGGGNQVWQEVNSQATEFIELAEKKELMEEDTEKWESFKIPGEESFRQQLGPYLYLARGRAALSLAMAGAVTDPEATLAEAKSDIEKAQTLDPNNPQVYWQLARAVVANAEILARRGNFEERDRARQQAEQLLTKAVEVAGDDVTTHLNLLAMKPAFSQTDVNEQLKSLEPEYLAIVDKFNSSADAYAALAGFYARLGHKNLDQALAAIEKAVELNKENVGYTLAAANLNYRKFSIYGHKPGLYKAIEIAKNALTLPDAQDKPGPRQWANIINRTNICQFLAKCYIEQVLEPCEARTDAEKQQWLENAEGMVYALKQIFGSGEDPRLLKWQGMLELAKGNREAAVIKLHTAYEQVEAAGGWDPQLSYILGRIFENTSETGAAHRFYANALGIPQSPEEPQRAGGIYEEKPYSLLEYADVTLKLKIQVNALGAVNFFENQYWPTERSRLLRIRINIDAGQLDEAEKELNSVQATDPNTLKLKVALVGSKVAQVQRAIARQQLQESLRGALQSETGAEKTSLEAQNTELKTYITTFTALVSELLDKEPNSVDAASVGAICEYYIAHNELTEAGNLVQAFLKHFPDDTNILYYQRLISEPEPEKVSEQRKYEIEELVLSEIDEPLKKSVRLGLFYQRIGEPNKAAEQFKKALAMETTEQAGISPAGDKKEFRRMAANNLVDIAFNTKDKVLAEQLAEIAKRENMDDCDGRFHDAVASIIKANREDALTKLNECLKQKPVFSRAFMLRSSVNADLGNEHAAIDDAQKASTLNPMDGAIAKGLWATLYRRNQRLGDNVSSEQELEAGASLRRAVELNPGDTALLSDYAEYIVATNPNMALGIRQSLQKANPSVRNATLLGRIAMRIALQEKDAKRRQALLEIAGSSFDQARQIDPHDKLMLRNYAEYYRNIGMPEKAEQLLAGSEDKRLLWAYYIRRGQLDEARKVLEQLYQIDAADVNTVQGLLLVARRSVNQEDIKKYSDALLGLEDTIDNRLTQIEALLEAGLIKEADSKFRSFSEKYPDEPRAVLYQAQLATRQGQLKTAMDLTNQRLEKDQTDAAAWRLRGEINMLLANYEQAIIDLRQSYSLSPELLTRISLAKAYRGAGRNDDAITELKSTINDPRAPMIARLLLEQMYVQLNMKDELRKFYDETVIVLPNRVRWCNRAAAFALNEGKFEKAERLYSSAWQKSIEQGTADIQSLDGFLQTLMLAGKLDKVFEESQKCVDGEGASIAFFRMAEAKLKMNDKAAAVELCTKAVDKAGTNGSLLTYILQQARSLIGNDELTAYCRQRLAAEPDSLAANLGMFNLMSLNGEYNKAVEFIDRCLEIAGKDASRRIEFISNKGNVLLSAYTKTSDKNYLERAVTTYESLLAEMPNNTLVLNNLAYMLAENDQKLPDGLEYARRVYEAEPDNPSFLDTYSYLLHKNGKDAEAVEFLQKALQQYESQGVDIPADVYNHLGMIKEKLGESAEALAAYKQALEVASGNLSDVAVERLNKAVERLSSQ
jgi:tetratricopeptide (TPR) repeat protein